jgi:hypothetical protein
MKKVFIAIAFLALANCSNYSAIRSSHQNDVVEPKIRPMAKASPVSGKSIKITSVNIEPNAIPDSAVFQKTATFVLPLLFINVWRHTTRYTVGRLQFKDRLEDHLKTAFEVGLSQFGYKITDANPDIEISINARKINSAVDYTAKGYFFFALVAYGYSYGDENGPYFSHLIFEVTTKEGGREYKSEIEGSAMLPVGNFNRDIDTDIERINHVLELSLNSAVANYSRVAPK